MNGATLYVRDGSRFVPVDEARPARPVPPIPTPAPIVDDEPAVDVDKPWRVTVPAPRCPHGSFVRWAARNCCADRSAPRVR